MNALENNVHAPRPHDEKHCYFAPEPDSQPGSLLPVLAIPNNCANSGFDELEWDFTHDVDGPMFATFVPESTNDIVIPSVLPKLVCSEPRIKLPSPPKIRIPAFDPREPAPHLDLLNEEDPLDGLCSNCRRIHAPQ